MLRALALRACACTALASPLALAGLAHAETIDVGTFVQLAPRPTIGYSGAWGSAVSSELVVNPVQRTLVTVDLWSIMQSAGLTHLESIEILDGGGNQYVGSPGADIDYVLIEGLGGAATSFGYTGGNGAHLLESSEILASRVAAMDAVSGDQDWNIQHFVSLGVGGSLRATFSTQLPPGGGSGGSGGFGPGEMQGGGGTGQPSYSNLVLATSALRLRISEAGLGENYIIRITGSTVPAPGALAALCAVALAGRRRRR
jgi:hypothetical protein